MEVFLVEGKQEARLTICVAAAEAAQVDKVDKEPQVAAVMED